MGKVVLLSVGLHSVSLFRNRFSATSREWMYFLFVYACRTICLCLYMFARQRKRGEQYTVIVISYKIYEGREETIRSRYVGSNKDVEIIMSIV